MTLDDRNIPTPEETDAVYIRRSSDDFELFVRGLYIPSATGRQLFDKCIVSFQVEFFRDIAPSLMALRRGDLPPWRRFWVERTKKTAKDSDVAIVLLWLMAFPIRPLLCPVSAANQEQAGIIKRRAKDIIFYNPWLSSRVTIQQNRIVGHHGVGEVKIEATGKSGAKQGDTPDLLVLNELVHVDRWDVNQTHMNNANGCPHGIVIVCTNAGIKGTPAEVWKREAIARKDRWKVYEYKSKAPWVAQADVDEAKRLDPVGAEYDRLWRGLWVSGHGSAVEDAAVERCFRLPALWLKRKRGCEFSAGLDLGISHDHAGLVVLGSSKRRQLIATAWVQGWAPSVPNDRGVLEVDIEEVERQCLWAHRNYGITWFGYDPAAGGSFAAQDLRKRGVPMREMSFSSPTNLDAMARSFVQAMKAGKLWCYDDPEGRLRRDFGKFNIESKIPTGYRLTAVSDQYGHADVGTALVIALPRAVELLGGLERLQPDDDVAWVDDGKPLSERDLKRMPDELKEMMTLYDEMEGR